MAYVKTLTECPDGAELGRGQKLLLLILADYHNTSLKAAWPAVVTLARECLTSLSQIKRDLDYLERHLVIAQRHPKKPGPGNYCTYVFLALDEPDLLQSGLTALMVSGVHPEPLFCSIERGPNGVHLEAEMGSRGVHPEQRNKEEREPKATKNKNLASASAAAGQSSTEDPAREHPELGTEPDPRHKAVECAIKRWYCLASDVPECPWTPKTGALLKGLLQRTPPSWTVAMLEQCAMHWIYSARGAGVPDRFIPRLLDRYDAPLNEYGNNDWERARSCRARYEREHGIVPEMTDQAEPQVLLTESAWAELQQLTARQRERDANR